MYYEYELNEAIMETLCRTSLVFLKSDKEFISINE